MTDYDERVNDEADEHAAKMQEQRASKQRLGVIRATYDVPKNHYEIKDDNNESSN